MKKIVPILAGCGVLAAAGFFLLRQSATQGEADPATLVEAGTPVFLCLPDLHASKNRWAVTALAKMAQDPEIAAFLEKPLAQIRSNESFSRTWDVLQKLDPGKAFVALTAIEDNEPRLVGGFQFSGTQADLDAAMAPAKERVRAQYPAGKADIESYEGVAIESYAAEDFHMASATSEGWHLVANSTELLKQTLDRLHGRDALPSLDSSENYKTLRSKLPDTVEALAIIQPETLARRFATLLEASGNADSAQMEAFLKLRGVAASTSFEGADLRDTIYVLGETEATRDALQMPVLDLSTANTLLVLATRLKIDPELEMPDPAMDASGFLSVLTAFLDGLEQQDLGLHSLADAFGPEIGASLDWAPESTQPGLVITADVQDRDTAARLIQTLTASYGSAGNISHVKEGEIDFYTMSLGGFVPVNPTVALDAAHLYIASDGEHLRSLFASTEKGALKQNPGFQQAGKKTGQPTESFAYLDMKLLFERVYGTLRPMLVFSAGMMPGVSQKIDPEKLPTTEAFTRHLSPIVFSQIADKDGILMSSAGPMTLNQFVLIGGTAAILKNLPGQFGN